MGGSLRLTRRLIALLRASLWGWTAGNGLFPPPTLYALGLGATVEGTGIWYLLIGGRRVR